MAKAPAKDKVYFIVNPSGCIHGVDYEHARWRLSQLGYRPATADEVKQLKEQGGQQVHDAPICRPWSPEPVEERLPDGQDESK